MTLADLVNLVDELKKTYPLDAKILVREREHGLLAARFNPFPGETGSPAFIEIEADDHDYD
jgi:hypothetical protein